jgi:hypothetical protein
MNNVTILKKIIILRAVFMKRILIIISLIFLFSFGANAQSLETGIFGGCSYYLGDLNPGMQFKHIKPAFGLLARYNLDRRWTFRLSAYHGEVKSNDANERRNLKFNSKITEISAQVELSFFPYFTGSLRTYFTPYIFAGVSMFMFNPKADGVKLRNIGTEGQFVGFDGRKEYKLTNFSIPFGFGFKYSLSKKVGLGFEWGIRKTYTDYIDDVSTTYYLDGHSIDPRNINQALSDPTFDHQPYMERGDPATNDWYAFAGITITYKFNLRGRTRCLDYGRRKKY